MRLLAPWPKTVEALLEEAGLATLPTDPTLDAVEAGLRKLVAALDGADVLRVMTVRAAATNVLASRKVKYASRCVSAAFKLPDDECEFLAPPPPDVDPWPQPVNGAALLDEIRALVLRYVALPAHAPEILAAFALATHAVDAFNAVTYLFLSSPTAECGKTKLLEVLELVVCRPWRPAILTGPVLFRGIEQYEPTLLLDEAEVIRGRGDAADNVRAVLHVGYRRGAVVERCVGEDFELRSFRTFGFKVFACIGKLPPTLVSRCIVIPMRRRGPNEVVRRFLPRALEAERVALQRKCQRWATEHLDAVRTARPTLPEVLSDRQAEIWEPLLAVGLVAGGGWCERLASAARGIHGALAHDDDSGVDLLADLRELFRARDASRLASSDIVTTLTAREDRPWAEWKNGRPLTARQLAGLLEGFEIRPTQLRIGAEKVRGYELAAFADAFARYLPSLPVHAVQSNDGAERSPFPDPVHAPPVPDRESPENRHADSLVPHVPDEAQGGRAEVPSAPDSGGGPLRHFPPPLPNALRGDAWEPEDTAHTSPNDPAVSITADNVSLVPPKLVAQATELIRHALADGQAHGTPELGLALHAHLEPEHFTRLYRAHYRSETRPEEIEYQVRTGAEVLAGAVLEQLLRTGAVMALEHDGKTRWQRAQGSVWEEREP